MAVPHPTSDDLDLLLDVLPDPIRRAVESDPSRADLVEIVLDLGRLPEARFPDRVVGLSSEVVSATTIEEIVARLGRFGTDNRAGIERTLHRISAIRNRLGEIIGLTCRVGRAVYGTIEIVRDVIESGSSVLLLGRPGVGKTTLLREAARVLADELDKRVMIVDTSNEIAGDGDVPHPGIGQARRMQVPAAEAQHAVMIEAVENHMPEVIVIDEIGTSAEALAARTIAERGVQLVATAHGNALENLLQNPTLADLVGGIQAVILSDEEARRRHTQKTVLERKAPPTFEVVVEIQKKDRLAVHHEVSRVVDLLLRGQAPRPQVRTRTAEGAVEIESPPPPVRHVVEEQTSLRQRKPLRIFPFAVSRSRLARAIQQLAVPVLVVDHLREANVALTVKSQVKRLPPRLRDAPQRGIRIEVIRTDTVRQIEQYLRQALDLPPATDDAEQVRTTVDAAIDRVLDEGRPVELTPADRTLRRRQHELVHEAGLVSRSRGDEPFRRVVVYPT